VIVAAVVVVQHRGLRCLM